MANYMEESGLKKKITPAYVDPGIAAVTDPYKAMVGGEQVFTPRAALTAPTPLTTSSLTPGMSTTPSTMGTSTGSQYGPTYDERFDIYQDRSRKAQYQALTGREEFSPLEMEAKTKARLDAWHKARLASKETALREKALEQQNEQFNKSFGLQTEQFGFEKTKFGETQALAKEKFSWEQETWGKSFDKQTQQWQDDYNLRLKEYETRSQLDRDKFEENKRQFGITYGFDYEKFLELKRQFDVKHSLDVENQNMKKEEMDQKDWQSMASLALNAPLLYANLARSLWNSTNPWEDLKEGSKDGWNAIEKAFTDKGVNVEDLASSYGGDYGIGGPIGDVDLSDNYADYEAPPVAFEPDSGLETPYVPETDYGTSYSDFDMDMTSSSSDLTNDLFDTGVSEGAYSSIDMLNSTPALTDTALDLYNSGGDVTSSAMDIFNSGGDVTSTVSGASGSIPYVGLANMAKNVATGGAKALVSPSTVTTAATTTASLYGGMAAAGPVGLMGAALVGYITLMKKYAAGTGMGLNPLYTNPDNGISNSAMLAADGVRQPGIDEAETMQFMQSKLPSNEVLAARFQAQTGYSVPTSAVMANAKAKYYQEWVAKQPEFKQAQAEWSQYVADNYTTVYGGAEGTQPSLVKNEEYLTMQFGY